jgi:membrane fusion protein, multidrug efflux system
MRRRALATMVLGAALLTGCGGEAAESPEGGGAAPAAPATRAVLVRTAAPQVESVEDMVELPGDLLPARRAVLSAEVSGRVEAVNVDLGDPVRAGQQLVRIDTRALQQQVAEAESVHRQAAAQLERARNLFERQSITQKNLLDAITNEEVARARLASAKLELSKSAVAAPWSGRVAERHVEVGDFAAPGQPLVTLVDASRLRVRAPAPAADVPYLEVGKAVQVGVDALPGRLFPGTVTRLGAELDPDARTLDVEVEIPNPDGRLRPGMLARVTLPRRTLDDAILVPLNAVVDLGDEQVVYVVEDGRARRRPVELGAVLGRRVVVVSGVGFEDRVVVEGTQQVSEGQAVREAS